MAKRRYQGIQKNSKILKGAIICVLLVAASLFITFTDSPFLSVVKNSGLTVISVFQKGISSVISSTKNKLNAISELKELQEAHKNDLERLNVYTGIERYVTELKKENELLRNQLDFSGNIETEHIPCEIISKDPENLFASIVIDKGSKDGLKKNMAVTAYQDGIYGLVGKIMNVGLSSSIVMPIFDSTSYLSARLQSSRYEGLVNGAGGSGDYIVMNYVKKTARSEISNGDMIITSGMKSIYPKGLNIGRVNSVYSGEYDSSLEIEIIPVINFSKLEYVFVITGREYD
ncbi:MAG: rod shape-determining protein MreC [Spirochaetaceae bacterium]|jgi:rod shape-determining protein MreC|nr:rod shape-determining protein MreC [Spirochaetaceae bacterium]